MFLFKLFGVLDLVAAATTIFIHLDVVGFRLPTLMAGYLLMKGFLFNWDALSILDSCAAAYLLLSLVWSALPLSILVAGYLAVKGIFSLL